MHKLKTATLGCKVNQYETEFVRQALINAGYHEPVANETVDLCIVNTCTVTNEGDAKSRQLVRRLARDNPEARIVVMGCYATRAPEEVASLPQVVEVVTDKRELPDLLGRFGVMDVPTGISSFGNRHRAFVKVQDGCLLRCSYCIIPQVRPELASRPVDHILDEVRRLVDNGYSEVVLTGIHLGHYGVDWNIHRRRDQWIRLSDLVRQIVELDGDFRVRLSSIEATEVTRELVNVMAEYPHRICPHLHICLQSGSESVLRRMHRRWGARRFLDRCALVKQTLDQPALTTDVIVGFPGETDSEFQETCDVVQEVGFSKIHVFPFSSRRGTPAAEMSHQISKKIKAERGRELTQIESELRKTYFNSLIGNQMRVLVETVVDQATHRVAGTSCRYTPVELESDSIPLGQLVAVKAVNVQDDRLVGITTSGDL